MIGQRISFEEHQNHHTIIISSRIDKFKERLMLIWIMLWTFCGLTFLYYLLFTESLKKEETLFLFVLFIFWLYFEILISRAYLWRVKGVEYIKVNEDRFYLKRSILGYGKARSVFTSNIINTSPVELAEKSFAKVFNDSFWIVGKGTLLIKAKEDEIYVGAQLEKKDVEALSKKLNKIIKRYQK